MVQNDNSASASPQNTNQSLGVVYMPMGVYGSGD
jgi:hypothetical protein